MNFFPLSLFLQDPTKDREAEFILEYIENFFEVSACMDCETSTVIIHQMFFLAGIGLSANYVTEYSPAKTGEYPSDIRQFSIMRVLRKLFEGY